MTGPRRRRTPALAALLLGVLLALVPALPAAAHDALVASDPAADAVVAALPAAITLTFTADILTEPGTAQLQVTDASGADLVAGDPVVAGTTVTTPLAGEADGLVRVLWRVVSSDGHPISGEFSFTVTPVAETAPPATDTPSPTTPSDEPTTAPPTSTPVPISAASEASAAPWIIGGTIAVAGIGAAVVALLAARARGRRGPGTSSR